jgi:hypothetical protein
MRLVTCQNAQAVGKMSYWKASICMGKRYEIAGHWQTESREYGIAKPKIDTLVSELFFTFSRFASLCDHTLGWNWGSQHWGLNPRENTCKAGDLLLEPCLHPFHCGYFRQIVFFWPCSAWTMIDAQYLAQLFLFIQVLDNLFIQIGHKLVQCRSWLLK